MIRLRKFGIIFLAGLALTLPRQAGAISFYGDGQSQASAHNANEQDSFPALLVSDIHFDPFLDPAKARQLVSAPLSQWNAILSAPPSADQGQAVAELQQRCSGRGQDASYTLLQSSLQAMRTQAADAKFITVSGDLIAHSFFCKYTALVPGSKSGDYQAFVLNTLNFVLGELRSAFPGRPIYVALGNNDTACDDYRLDAGSDFLDEAGRIIALSLPASEQQAARRMFAQGGYYSSAMGTVMPGTRLIVINDLFLSPKYSTCAGKANATAGAEELAWLRNELSQLRKSGQKAWVMGHIPPGADPYSTAAKFKDICAKDAPEMFLASDDLADLLIEYADVIRLGIFAHSHMDEMRLLQPQNGDRETSDQHSVAVKILPSISPVDGNDPSFTIARIDPAAALLQDYEVIAASNLTGIAAAWSREYDYAQVYHQTQFSPAALKELISTFENDSSAKTAASQEYLRDYFVGDRSAELKPLWRPYVCTLANHTARAFAACVCSAGSDRLRSRVADSGDNGP